MPLSLTLLALAAAADARQPPLASSGPWNVHAESSYCMLSRVYGTGAGRVEVAFQPSIGDGSLTLLLATPARGGQETGEAKVTRQPDGQSFQGRYYSVPATGNKQRITQIWLSSEVFSGLERTEALRIQARPVDIAVAIPRSDKAMTTFRGCEDGLLQSWGIRPEAFRKGTRPSPKDSVADYFRYYNYPRSALIKGYIGHVRAAVVVGADGIVKDCRVVTRIGPAFDKVTCDQARKIPFAPGHDEKGVPTQSLFTVNVRWAMGRG